MIGAVTPGLCQQPGQGDLGRRDTAAGGHTGGGVHDVEIRFPGVQLVAEGIVVGARGVPSAMLAGNRTRDGNTTYTLDSQQRVTKVTDQSGNSSSFTYNTFDAVNNITGKVSIYSYDKASRLTGATNVAGHTYGYTYDADGNRTSAVTDGTTTQSLTFNSASQISTSGYAYDGAGNMTAAPGATYSYNAAEQMASPTVNGTTTPHVYAGGTQQELTSAGTNQFIWGHNDQYGQPWMQSFNTNGGSQAYVERDQSGAPLGLHIAGQDYYLVTDNLGSVVAAIDTAGNVAAQYSYDPYGATVTASETGLGGVPNIVRYTGGTLDQTTGLLKLGQRYYNPATGTFTQQDANQILSNRCGGRGHGRYCVRDHSALPAPPRQ